MTEEGSSLTEFMTSSISRFSKNNFDEILLALNDLGLASAEIKKSVEPCALA